MAPNARPRQIARLLVAVVATLVIPATTATLIAYAGAVIFGSIAGGVFTGAPVQRRRERTIDQLHDHFIICSHGRVGRRVGEEFRASGVPYVVVDLHRETVAG